MGLFVVVGEKTRTVFLKCIKKPLGNARLVSVILRNARRTHAFYMYLKKI